MVTGVLVSIIAAGILRMAMLRYALGQRSVLMLQEKRDTQGGMAAVVAQWSTVTGPTSVCSGPPPGWGGCSNPGVCNCTCTQPGVNGVTIVASPSGALCQLSIRSIDRTQ